MTETTSTVAPAVDVPPREMTLMDLWLIVRVRKYLSAAVVGIAVVMGIVLALALPVQHRFTTVIEIGDQIVNDEIEPIEALTTVVAKLQDGYIPTATIQFVEAMSNGPGYYSFEVAGSEESQIVTVVSKGPRGEAPSHIALHGRIADALIQDHNRTADAMRGNAAILLAQAKEERGRLIAEEKAAAEQIEMFGSAIANMEKQSAEVEKRVALLDEHLSVLRSRPDSSSATQAMLLSQQIGELMTLQAEVNEKASLDLRIKRSNTQARLATIVQQQETACSAIRYSETTRQNIQATRVLGDGTIISMRPVAPSKAVVIIVALIIGLVVAVVFALALDFFAKARGIARAAEP